MDHMRMSREFQKHKFTKSTDRNVWIYHSFLMLRDRAGSEVLPGNHCNFHIALKAKKGLPPTRQTFYL